MEGKEGVFLTQNTLAPIKLKVLSSKRLCGRGRFGEQPNYLPLINVLGIIEKKILPYLITVNVKLIVINHSQNSGQLYTNREMLVTVLSEKNTVINYRHRMISSSELNIKVYIWQYTYTIINASYLKLTNTYGANNKIWDIKATH